MPETKKLMATLILGILIGVAVFSLMGNSFSLSNSVTIPSGHQSVADKVHIVVDGVQYSPVCVSSGATPPLSILPLSFMATGSVQNSIWEYRSISSDSTTNYAFLTIFGPDNSGSNYWVEVSRASSIAISLTYPGNNFSFGAGDNSGYCYFEVAL